MTEAVKPISVEKHKLKNNGGDSDNDQGEDEDADEYGVNERPLRNAAGAKRGKRRLQKIKDEDQEED